MTNRYLWVKGADHSILDKTLAEKYKITHDYYIKDAEKGFNTLMNGPWDRALVPLKVAQLDAITDSILMIDSSNEFLREENNKIALNWTAIKGFLNSSTNRKLHSPLKDAAKQFNSEIKSFDDFFAEPQEDSYISLIKNTTAISAACAQLSLLKAPSCVRATSELLEELSYRGNMILPKIWSEFFKNEKLSAGTVHAAIKMIERIESKNPGYILSDLSSSFEKAGLSQQEALEAAWKVMALYGNGGANTGYRLALFDLPENTSKLAIALSIIGTSVSYLDYSQRFSGLKHYAFPGEVKDSCIMPKPYHFWLNAYLARWLVKRGYSSEVAQMATFIAAKGYQVNRDLNNAGGGLNKILSKPNMHPTNQVVRLDLALSASGAVYGSLQEKGSVKSFSINQGITKLVSVAGNPEALSEGVLQQLMGSDRIRLLYLWDQLFQPNSALEFYQKIQSN